MRREIISSKQGVTLLILFIFGSTFVVGTGGEAKKDMWLAVIIAIIGALPMYFIYAKLLMSFPEKDLYDIVELVFGKLLGKAIILLYIFYSLHLGGLVVYNFNEFIGTVGLEQTPMIIPSSIMMVLCIWMLKQGIEGLARWGELFFPILISIVFLAAMFSIPNLDINNILPIAANGINPIAKGAFDTFSFPLTEAVLFTVVFSSLKNSKAALKTYILALIIAGGTLVISVLRNILVLGEYVISINYYPTFVAVARINIGNFLQRLESALSITFLIAGFVKICICLLAASKGFAKVLNFKDYRFIVIPQALMILNFSFIVTKDAMDSRIWNQQVYPYYAFIFEVILPLIIFICAKLRYKELKKL